MTASNIATREIPTIEARPAPDKVSDQIERWLESGDKTLGQRAPSDALHPGASEDDPPGSSASPGPGSDFWSTIGLATPSSGCSSSPAR